MTLRIACSFVLAALALLQSEPPNIAGIWVLNPALTVRPAEIGFTPPGMRPGGSGEGGARQGGGRGRRGGGGSSSNSGAPGLPAESIEDGTRIAQLTEQVRTPPAHVTIVQKPGSVSIADDQGHARTFHTDGALEQLTIGTVPLPTTTRWDAGSLVVVYDVTSDRKLRYTFTPSGSPVRLLVDVRFIEQGREGDEVRLTYEPQDAHDKAVLSDQPAGVAPEATLPPAGPGTAGTARPATLPPGSELRGLTTIATEVEDLSAQAGACGLDREKIRTSIARLLADAGFKAPTSGREDAYVLINVATSKLPDGACVSRYDASLVTHGDTTFPYLKGTVAAVEVQLLHDGGMLGGSPSTHAAAIADALTKSVNRFVAQVRAAGK